MTSFLLTDGKRFADMLTNIHWLGSLPNDVMNPIKLKDSSHQTVTEVSKLRYYSENCSG